MPEEWTGPVGSVNFAPGDTVVGRYRLERIVGEGGVGIVWAATHLTTGRRVAIKILKRNEPEDAARLLREAQVAASLQHRNIVQVFDLFQLPNTGILLMVMDLLQGESLAERIEREGRMPISLVAQILSSVASALKSAHAQGFVHRDLKPENIFLAKENDGQTVVKVLDFGLARPTDTTVGTKITQTGALLGTPHYMAPEQVYGEKVVDRSADTWALGAILVECLSGHVVFTGENFGQIFKKIASDDGSRAMSLLQGFPADIVELAARMLSHDRAKRPTDDDVLASLRAHQPPSAEGSGENTILNLHWSQAIAASARDIFSMQTRPTYPNTSSATSIDPPRLRTRSTRTVKWFGLAGLLALCVAIASVWAVLPWLSRAVSGLRPAPSAAGAPPSAPLAPATVEALVRDVRDVAREDASSALADAGDSAAEGQTSASSSQPAKSAEAPASATPGKAKSSPKPASPLDLRF